MSTTKTHSAAVLQAVGSNLVIEERPTPSPGAREVLLRNHAVGLNPIEWKVQSYPMPMVAPPVILGTGKHLPSERERATAISSIPRSLTLTTRAVIRTNS